MADRGLVYILPNKTWYYCRYTGSWIIESLDGIGEATTLEEIEERLDIYEKDESETSYSFFLCRMVELDLVKNSITLKDAPKDMTDIRKVRWSGTFQEFNVDIKDVSKIWKRM